MWHNTPPTGDGDDGDEDEGDGDEDGDADDGDQGESNPSHPFTSTLPCHLPSPFFPVLSPPAPPTKE